MSPSDPRPTPNRSILLPSVIALEVLLLAVLAWTVFQLREDIEAVDARATDSMEMVLGTYTLRQSSDYLTRFARRYAVTGDPLWRDIYQQVLDIRRGEALRPKDYESVYWDLIEPYRSNAHPLLFPQSLRSILEGLPFTPAELALLQEAEDNSENLAGMELAAFLALEEEGRQGDAVAALFSIDYMRAKHTIMQPIDELMVRVRRRVEAEQEAALARTRRHTDLVIASAAVMLIANMVLLALLWRGAQQPRRPARTTPPAGPADELPSETETA